MHPSSCAESWIEDSFADFADGRLDAGGQNLYVSRDGSLRTIHRFDVNDDGFLDLFFGNTHDLATTIAPTLAVVESNQQVATKSLPVSGSDRLRAADLNRDDCVDLVFCLNSDGLQTPRRFISILYGSTDGWSSRRSTGHLPAHNPIDIAIVDLNDDSWSDIVVLNDLSSPPKLHLQRSIWIYWGSADGFLSSRCDKLPAVNANAMAASDFDGNGAFDLALLVGDVATILWAEGGHAANELPHSNLPLETEATNCLAAVDLNSDGYPDLAIGTAKAQLVTIMNQRGRQFSQAATSQAPPATHIATGDLDGDGRSDLVLTNFEEARAAGGEAAGAADPLQHVVTILWGELSADQARGRTQLEVPFAQATAIGDANADGFADLAIAAYQGNTSFRGQSLLMFGTGRREFSGDPLKITTEGAADVLILPTASGSQDAAAGQVIFANSIGGTLYERVPAYLYWGSADGFSPQRRWEIPAQSSHEASAADLNADGFVELIVLFTAHGGSAAVGSANVGANIFWGGQDGFDLSRRTVLPERYMSASNVADLNRDGFLDLVLGGWNNSNSVSVYYGSADRFDPKAKRPIDSHGAGEGAVIGDFNKDDWLDLAVSSTAADRVRVYFGSDLGFDESRRLDLVAPSPIGIESADLNADGFLDLIVASYSDRTNEVFDGGNFIFWGSAAGFRHFDAQWLPGNCTLFHTVADFDGDGSLDLFCPNYHGQLNREHLPSFLFWGASDGFNPRRFTPLLCNSASDGFAGDFDGDGKIDLAIANHTAYGDHQTDSQVFYNNGLRFEGAVAKKLPTRGVHYMWMQDMGHIYDRKWRQTYESSIFQWEQQVSGGKLTFESDIPNGLEFSIRSAQRKESLSLHAWRPIRSEEFSLISSHRYLQYQAIFKSENGDRYPVLNQVQIELK